MVYVVSVLAGFLYGCLFCYINHKVLQRAVDKVDPAKEHQKAATEVMKAYLFRYLISFVALVAVIFICKLLPLHFLSTIIAATVGITVPSQIWHITHDKNTGEIWHNSADADRKWQNPDAEAKKAEEDEENKGWQKWENWEDDNWRESGEKSSEIVDSSLNSEKTGNINKE